MQHSLLLQLCSFLLFRSVTSTSRFLLKDSYINSTSLTVTSFAFHPHGKLPEWSDSLLGSNAVFWNTAELGYELGNSPGDILSAKRRFQDTTQLPPLTEDIECSIELMGFARLGTEQPFRGSHDRNLPAVGTAFLIGLQRGLYNKNWPCFWRAIYSNKRVFDSKESYWTVVLLCTAPKGSDMCVEYRALSVLEKEAQFELQVQLPHTTWVTMFTTIKHEMMHEKVHGIAHLLHDKLAVCTVWPYASSRPENARLNNALIYEFVRYYSTLGIQIIVFDRDGGNWPGSFSSAYAKSHPQKGKFINAIKTYLDYNDFTIHGILNPLPEGETLRADMADYSSPEERSRAVAVFDNDKELTYSHCRFHAQSKYGVSHVIVADFDEFLYCKQADPNPMVQSSFLAGYIEKIKEHGIDQILFRKSLIANKHPTNDARECMFRELDKNEEKVTSGIGSTGSIFNCFPSVDYSVEKLGMKSIELNRKCPFSGLNHACSPSLTEQHAYDCLCNSTKVLSSCEFVNLGGTPQDQEGAKASRAKWSDGQISGSNSELWAIVNAQD